LTNQWQINLLKEMINIINFNRRNGEYIEDMSNIMIGVWSCKKEKKVIDASASI